MSDTTKTCEACQGRGLNPNDAAVLCQVCKGSGTVSAAEEQKAPQEVAPADPVAAVAKEEPHQEPVTVAPVVTEESLAAASVNVVEAPKAEAVGGTEVPAEEPAETANQAAPLVEEPVAPQPVGQTATVNVEEVAQPVAAPAPVAEPEAPVAPVEVPVSQPEQPVEVAQPAVEAPATIEPVAPAPLPVEPHQPAEVTPVAVPDHVAVPVEVPAQPVEHVAPVATPADHVEVQPVETPAIVPEPAPVKVEQILYEPEEPVFGQPEPSEVLATANSVDGRATQPQQPGQPIQDITPPQRTQWTI